MATRLDGLSAVDLARIYRIAGMAAIRDDTLTDRQEKAINRIVARSHARRDKK